MGYARVGPQEVYQQNSYAISGFNRPMRLRQARPPGGLRTGEPFATLLNENPGLGLKISETALKKFGKLVYKNK